MLNYYIDDFEGRFIYVDIYTNKLGWKRIRISEAREEVQKYTSDVYATIQQWEKSKFDEGELEYTPLYFDLDGKFEETLEDAKKIIQFFEETLELKQPAYQIFFSGCKGFHIIIHQKVFGILPSNNLTYIHKDIAQFLTEVLNLKTLDERVYSRRRQLRVLNTKHSKSKLYKVEISREELFEITSFNDISAISSKPRNPLFGLESFEILSQFPLACTWFQSFVKAYQEKERLRRFQPIEKLEFQGEHPPCVEQLLNEHIQKENTRNMATLALATYFKDIGTSPEETLRILIDWILKIPRHLTSKKTDRELIAATKSVVDTVYRYPERYHFICAVMKNLGMECNILNCPVIKHEQKLQPISLSLKDAFSADYVGIPSLISIIPIGRSDTNYVYPKSVRFTCQMQNSQKTCSICPMMDKDELIIEVPQENIVSLIKISDSGLEKYLRGLARIPNCKYVKAQILEFGDAIEMEAVENINPLNDSSSLSSSESIVRPIIYLNKTFPYSEEIMLQGRTVRNPKDQSIIYIADSVISTSSTISSFELSEEDIEALTIFQAGGNINNIQKKLDEIYEDLENNIINIYERRDMLIAIDLIFHTPLFFRLDNRNHKGWGELFILGDTGSGKTSAIEAFIKFYGLGVRVSGESSKRTGLAWTYYKYGDQWRIRFGIIPMNDRKLVVIDEFSGIPEEEFKKLTDMRSSGIADARGGVVSGIAYARTRLIYISNPKSGLSLNHYTFPISALKELMPRKEDIRRLDLVIGARTEDVDVEILHSFEKKDVEHNYENELCRKLILWIWSRNPEQIIIKEEALKKVETWARYLSNRYSVDIPLCMASDLKLKIIRLSLGLAGRLFSTDDGENLILEPEHVEFIGTFLKKIYDSPSLDFLGYSHAHFDTLQPSEEFLKEIIGEIIIIPNSIQMANFLLITPRFNKSTICEMLGWDGDEFKEAMRKMAKFKLIEASKNRGYRITPFGILVMKRLLEKEDELQKIQEQTKSEIERKGDEKWWEEI
ncbi:MAG: hypothetical protein ACTSRP_01940 [Candidatus Helarchaeota archaeon]